MFTEEIVRARRKGRRGRRK